MKQSGVAAPPGGAPAPGGGEAAGGGAAPPEEGGGGGAGEEEEGGGTAGARGKAEAGNHRRQALPGPGTYSAALHSGTSQTSVCRIHPAIWK